MRLYTCYNVAKMLSDLGVSPQRIKRLHKSKKFKEIAMIQYGTSDQPVFDMKTVIQMREYITQQDSKELVAK